MILSFASLWVLIAPGNVDRRTLASSPEALDPDLINSDLPSPNVSIFALQESYTNNVLKNPRFVEIELESHYRKQWEAQVASYGQKSWKLSSYAIRQILDKERRLVQDLVWLKDQGSPAQRLARMEKREETFQSDLEKHLSPAFIKQYRSLKKGFFAKQLQVSL